MENQKVNLYSTWIQAINPATGRLDLFAGPIVPGVNMADAQDYCNRNNLAYCMVNELYVTDILTCYTNFN